MPIIIQRFEFDAGHRVLGHEGKCATLHGHRYVVEVGIFAPTLDTLGRVIDFGEVKKLLGGWLDTNWDHILLLDPRDPLAILRSKDLELAKLIIGPKDPYFLLQGNPTAENMVVELSIRFATVLLKYNKDLQLKHVRLWETPNCSALWQSSTWKIS